MVLSKELRTELSNPESWHWKIHQKGLRNRLRGAVRLVQGLVSREQVHVVEILEELERKKKDVEFKELWAFLGELQKHFAASGHNEAATAVQKTINDFREDAKKRKGRRTLLIAGGGLLLAEAAFELLGGRGVIRTVHGLLTTEQSRGLSKEELARVYLPNEQTNPSFHIGNVGTYRERAEYYVEDVRALLKNFDSSRSSSLDDIRRQVALLELSDWTPDEKDPFKGEWDHLRGQKLLIPTRDPYSALIIGDLHTLKARNREHNRLWVDSSLFVDSPETDMDFLSVEESLLAYSEELDLAIAWCYTPSLKLKLPAFSTRQTKNQTMHVVTSGSQRNKEWPPVKGRGINENELYTFVDVTTKRGYSGAPMTFSDGRIAAILLAGLESAEGKSLGLTLGIKATAVKQLLEFYIKAMGNKTVEQAPQ